MDPNKSNPTTNKTKNAAAKQEEKDASKPVFRTLGLDEEPDQVNYRSIATAGPMPSLATGPIMGGMNFMVAPPTLHMGAKLNQKSPNLQAKRQTAAAPRVAVRVDKTKYVGAVAQDLPPPPFRLELHTHFHVKNESMARIASVVGRKLCELDTDFVFSASKCKWKVEYRRSSVERVQLNIVIFKSNQEFVLEVQRRSGDITAAMHLFGELKSFLKRNQLLSDKRVPSSPLTGVKRPAPSSSGQTFVSADQLKESVASIKGLLENKFMDVKLQGVLAAISLTTRDDSKTALAALIPNLVALGNSKHESVAKLVGVVLSRLCDHPLCRQALVESEGWQFIVRCAAGGQDICPEVQRESLHVVECLCPLYHDELAKVEGASKVLELVKNWQKIEDPRLKKHACNAYRALQDAGVTA